VDFMCGRRRFLEVKEKCADVVRHYCIVGRDIRNIGKTQTRHGYAARLRMESVVRSQKKTWKVQRLGN
jgi:hypothetical protein